MLIFTMFMFASGTAYAASRVAWPLLACLAIAYPLLFVFSFFEWLNDKTGFTNLINNSWIFLSGANGPGDVFQHNEAECGSLLSLVMMLLGGVTIVLSVIPILIAFFGIPIGTVATIGGGLLSVATRERFPFIYGTSILAIALGCLIIAGLLMRVEHTLTGIASC